jgi:hypothetical protein
VNLGRRLLLGGWRRWVAVVLLTLALFVFFFAACGKGEGEPTRPPAAARAPGT